MTYATFKGGPIAGKSMALPGETPPRQHIVPVYDEPPIWSGHNEVNHRKVIYMLAGLPRKVGGGNWEAVYEVRDSSDRSSG